MAKKLTDELIELNRVQSEKFTDAGQSAARRRYRAEHPTEIGCLKCMDGRINMPIITNTPMGIIQPFRNIGGVFDLGWLGFSQRIKGFVDYSVCRGRPNLILVTYHWSKGDKHRGCRGQGYDLERAKRSAWELTSSIGQAFGKGHEQVYPVLIGIETDDEELVIHDKENARSAGLAQLIGSKKDKFQDLLKDYYPDMAEKVREDFLPLLMGNAEHVSALRSNPRQTIDLQHRERVIAFGQGFDWLHQPNLALIISDFDPNMLETVGTAAGIIHDNRDAGRIPNTGALLFTSVSYMQPGYERNLAVERAKWLTKNGLEAIKKYQPDMVEFFHPLTAVCNWHTRRLEIIE